VRNDDVNTEEAGFDVVAAPVEVADKVDENEKVAKAGVDSGDASVEKAKSDYIRRSMLSGKGPTVRGFYKERAAATSAKEKQQNESDTKTSKKTSKKRRRQSRSSSSSSSNFSNVSSSVSACCLD
jgi:homoserine kinase